MKLILNKKQFKAWQYLNDDKTTEILFGGGARGGKTWLGCCWLLLSATSMPESSWAMCRRELKRLKSTTFRTFLKACKQYGFEIDIDFKVNWQDSTINFSNGSVIFLIDMDYKPSDPEFDRLGSYDLTGAFMDEAQEIRERATSILKGRFSELKKEGFFDGRPFSWHTSPKCLMTCNPKKNWIYKLFYRPNKEGTIEPWRVFIPSLVTDNKRYVEQSYIDNLKHADKVTRERLLYGNFEYDDDPSKLFELDVITDLFTNKAEKSDEKYLSVDVARFGEDKTVVTFWKGYRGRVQWKKKLSTTEVADWVKQIAKDEQVRYSHIIIDEDGVGGGVLDQIKGAKGFLNGSRAIQPKESEFEETRKVNFGNLKAQCYFQFALRAKQGKVEIECDSDVAEWLSEDLEQVKEKDIDKDGKVYLVGKDEVKEHLGRSPDFSDSLAMRFWFDISPKTTVYFDSF